LAKQLKIDFTALKYAFKIPNTKLRKPSFVEARWQGRQGD